MKLRKFKRGDNFFFQMLTDSGVIILESQPCHGKDARDSGVESLKENIRTKDRYDLIKERGKSYFILKAANGQEIGRSPEYDNVSDLQTFLNLIQSGPQDDGGEAYGTDGKTDDYKPLAFYQSYNSGVVNGFDRFFAEEEHYFTYNLGHICTCVTQTNYSVCPLTGFD